MTKNYDLIVIGGGPAGLAAAYSAHKNGTKNILIIERDNQVGGILNQCIHNGFGLHYFKEELTGPEYAERFINLVKNTDIEIKTDTMVLEVTPNKTVYAMNPIDGFMQLNAEAIILAMGCRERTRGAISIAGDRPAGIFTAGTAQKYINIDGYMVGKRVVILGSGDIGLIMARRMTLEGAKVLGVVELMPYSNGLNRNIVQCLDDFDIPLYLSHTVTNVKGNARLESITVSKVDGNRVPIKGSEINFECDTLLLSVGLIPENEVSKTAGVIIDPLTNGAVVYEDMQTSCEGIFACGNALHVHDLVDFVTKESNKSGKFASKYINDHYTHGNNIISVKKSTGVNYAIPQKIQLSYVDKFVELYFRVSKIYKNGKILIKCNDVVLFEKEREHMLPAEMESVILPQKIFDSLEVPCCITVEIVEGGVQGNE